MLNGGDRLRCYRDLIGRLNAGPSGVLVLEGPNGIGKTELLRTLHSEFPESVFIDLAKDSLPNMSEIAHRLPSWLLLDHVGRQLRVADLVSITGGRGLLLAPSFGVELDTSSTFVSRIELPPLDPTSANEVLRGQGVYGIESTWLELASYYEGNPGLLLRAGTDIVELFGGDLDSFLTSPVRVTGRVKDALDRRWSLLDGAERQLAFRIALAFSPVEVETVLAGSRLGDTPVGPAELLGLEKAAVVRLSGKKVLFSPVMSDFVIARLKDQIIEELQGSQRIVLQAIPILSPGLSGEPLNQQRNLLDDVTARYRAIDPSALDPEGLKQKIEKAPQADYAVGNLLNIAIASGCSLANWDLSGKRLAGSHLYGTDLTHMSLRNCDLDETTLTDSFGPVTAVAMSADGVSFVFGTFHGEVRAYDTRSWQQSLSFQGHRDWISAASITEKAVVLTAGADRLLRAWDLRTGELLAEMPGHEGRIRALAVHEAEAVTGSEDGTIRFWDLERWTCKQICRVHDNRVKAIASQPELNYFLSAGDDGRVIRWDWDSHHSSPLVEFGIRIRAIELLGTDEAFAAATDDGKIQFVSALPRRSVLGGSTKTWALAYDRTRRRLYSGGNDGEIRIWDIDSAKALGRVAAHRSWVRTLAIEPKGRWLVSGSEDQTASVWALPQMSCHRVFRGYSRRIFSLAVTPDGQRIVAGLGDGTIRSWNLANGRLLGTIAEHGAPVWSLALDASGERLAAGSDDGRVCLWDIASRQPLGELMHRAWIGCVALSQDASVIVTGADDGAVRVWRPTEGDAHYALRKHTGRVTQVLFHGADKLISTSEDGLLLVWHLSDRNVLCDVQTNHGLVFAAALSSAGDKLYTAGNDGFVRAWDALTFKRVWELKVNPGAIWSIALTNTGDSAALGGDDGTLHVIDTLRGTVRWNVAAHRGQVWAVAADNSRHIIISGGEDETIKLWNADSGEPLKTIEIPKPYQDVDITGIHGASANQLRALRRLGANASDTGDLHRTQIPADGRTFVQTLSDRLLHVINDYSTQEQHFQHGLVPFADFRTHSTPGSGPVAAIEVHQKERRSVLTQLLEHDLTVPTFSVIIPVRGCHFAFSECIQSLSRQSFVQRRPDSVEILIIEDGPAEGEEQVSAVLRRLRETVDRRSQMRLFHLRSQQGRSTARNVGVYHAANEILLFVDASMVLDAGFVAEHALRHARAKSVALLGFKENITPDAYRKIRQAVIDGSYVPSYTKDWKWSHALHEEEAGFTFRGRYYGRGDTVHYMEVTNNLQKLAATEQIGHRTLPTFFQTNLASVSRSAFVAMGGFEARFDQMWGFEDSFAGALLCANGTMLVPCPSSVAFKIEHAESSTKLFELSRHREQFRELISKMEAGAYREKRLEERIDALKKRQEISEEAI